MIGNGKSVNGAVQKLRAHVAGANAKKKPGSNEPGLRYWPREADTITFQEGLLSARATGGGGQMRNTNAQREDIMIRVSASQQPSKSHVSHAEIEGRVIRSNAVAVTCVVGRTESAGSTGIQLHCSSRLENSTETGVGIKLLPCWRKITTASAAPC